MVRNIFSSSKEQLFPQQAMPAPSPTPRPHRRLCQETHTVSVCPPSSTQLIREPHDGPKDKLMTHSLEETFQTLLPEDASEEPGSHWGVGVGWGEACRINELF